MHGVLTNLKFLRKKIVYLFAKQVFIISLLASPNHTNWKKRKKSMKLYGSHGFAVPEGGWRVCRQK